MPQLEDTNKLHTSLVDQELDNKLDILNKDIPHNKPMSLVDLVLEDLELDKKSLTSDTDLY
jgi:hypothetical protein